MPECVNYSRRWLCLGNKYFLTSTSTSTQYNKTANCLLLTSEWQLHPFKNPHRLPTEPMGVLTVPIPIPYPYQWESPWESPYPRQPWKYLSIVLCGLFMYCMYLMYIHLWFVRLTHWLIDGLIISTSCISARLSCTPVCAVFLWRCSSIQKRKKELWRTCWWWLVGQSAKLSEVFLFSRLLSPSASVHPVSCWLNDWIQNLILIESVAGAAYL